MFLIIHETYRYVLMGACRRSPTSLGHVEALCNAEATSSITDQERAMEEKIHQSSFLKRQELRGVLAERSRSLQASERCREEELRQEAKIRLDYDIDVAKLVYDLDLKGKDESEVAQAVAQARKREGPVCALSTDVLESVRRRRVGVNRCRRTCRTYLNCLPRFAPRLHGLPKHFRSHQALRPIAM